MIKPREDNVLVEVISETQTPGGIVLSNPVQDPLSKGRVLAVDVEFMGKELTKGLEVGNVVLFPTYDGFKLTVDGKTQVLLKQERILAVVE